MSTTSVAPGPGAPAGFLLRLVATIIDSIIIAIPIYILNYILLTSTGNFLVASIIVYLIAAVVSLAYWGVMESGANQATLGKKVMKIKVASTSGAKLDLPGALKRNWIHWAGSLLAIIDLVIGTGFILAGILGILILVSCIAVAFKSNKQGFHDDWAAAQVVRA